MNGTKPRIDRVSGEFFRKGKCERCGKQAERTKTFTGPSIKDCERQAGAWAKRPLLHRKCEL